MSNITMGDLFSMTSKAAVFLVPPYAFKYFAGL